MIPVNMRGFSKVLSAVVVLAMMTGSAHAGQDRESTYPPDGTWLAFATQGNVKRPFMDTYASLQNQHGLRGTVVRSATGRRFVVLVDLIHRGVSVTVDAETLGERIAC